jgi:hypothetical protein
MTLASVKEIPRTIGSASGIPAGAELQQVVALKARHSHFHLPFQILRVRVTLLVSASGGEV